MDRLIVGAGEVGQALHTLLTGSHLRDVQDPGDLLDRYDVLHVCVPWQIPDFVQTVLGYTEQYHAWQVVIHSTVPVGTCDPSGWIHNPVQGRHPHLATSIGAFRQHYGGEGAESVAESLAEFFPVGYTTHELAATTEAAKLFSLAQYGMEIIMQKEIYEFCEANELPFEEVYTEMAGSYNRGWASLGEPRFTKPVLKHMPGSVGGHCVIAGAEMLPRKGFVEYLLQGNNVR